MKAQALPHPQSLSELFDTMIGVASENSQSAIIESGTFDNRRLSGIWIAMASVIGSLQVLASVIANTEKHGTQDAHKLVNDDTFLLAALFTTVCSHMGPGHDSTFVASQTNMTPENVMMMLDRFKVLTGRDGDDLVFPPMVREARRRVAESSETADALLRAICANQRPA